MLTLQFRGQYANPMHYQAGSFRLLWSLLKPVDLYLRCLYCEVDFLKWIGRYSGSNPVLVDQTIH